MLSLKIRVSGIAQGEGLGGPCPSPHFLCEIISTEIAAYSRLQQTSKIHRLIPKTDLSITLHPLMEIICPVILMVHHVVTSLGMNSSSSPPLGDHGY